MYQGSQDIAKHNGIDNYLYFNNLEFDDILIVTPDLTANIDHQTQYVKLLIWYSLK